MARIRIAYTPPIHGWLPITLTLDGKTFDIDASDVPNNPVEILIDALESIARGRASSVWWHMEPASYFMYFEPVRGEVRFRLAYGADGDARRAQEVCVIEGGSGEILMPFWRFLREFQSQAFAEPHWPDIAYSRLSEIKRLLGGGDN